MSLKPKPSSGDLSIVQPVGVMFIFLAMFLTARVNAQPLQPERRYPRPPERLILEKSPPTRIHALFDFNLGFAEYPVLELPMSENGNVRVDGSNGREDLMINRGLLIGIEISRRDDSTRVPYTLSLGGQRAASPPGAGLPTPSSYVRIFASASGEFAAGIGGLTLIPGLEARRSMYRNVDTGHYVDALYLKGGASYQLSSRVYINASGGYAPLSSFGVSQASGSKKSGTLAHTNVIVSEFSSAILWSPEPSTAFQLCLSEEINAVTVKNTDGYRAYGLPAAPSYAGPNAKKYDLTVRQIRIGTTKHF